MVNNEWSIIHVLEFQNKRIEKRRRQQEKESRRETENKKKSACKYTRHRQCLIQLLKNSPQLTKYIKPQIQEL